MTLQTVPMLHFGKLPSRGDFVRSSGAHAPLLQTLDRWLSGCLEAMSQDARWKLLYDRASPMQFAFLGPRNPRGLAGCLMATMDASGRRFPLITAAPIGIDDPATYLGRAPLALARPWHALCAMARMLVEAEDVAQVLGEFDPQLECEGSATAYDAAMRDFCELQTVGSLQMMLTQAGHQVLVRQLLLGLGLLLQPLPASGQRRLEKGLALPLPRDRVQRPLVASMWLELVGAFLDRADFELAMFLPLTPDDQPPTLWLGFDGASTRTLHAMFDPSVADEVFIDACAAEWVEPFAREDYAVRKLSSYLAHDGLSLRQAVRTFKETFLGQ